MRPPQMRRRRLTSSVRPPFSFLPLKAFGAVPATWADDFDFDFDDDDFDDDDPPPGLLRPSSASFPFSKKQTKRR